MYPLLSGALQRERFKAVSPYIRGDVLDLGCGYGKLVNQLRPGQYYVGIERHSSIVRWLEENHRGCEFHCRDLDTEDLSLKKRFDTILMIAIIEHLENPDRILSQIPKYLNPNGRLLITTPSPWGNRIHKIGARLGLFHMDAVRDHKTIFSRATLQAHLTQNGLQIRTFKNFLLGGNQLFVCEVFK